MLESAQEETRKQEDIASPTVEALQRSDAGPVAGSRLADFPVALRADPVQLDALDDALIQFRASVADRTMGDVKAIAARGVRGGGSRLPNIDRIQQAFGRHDVSGIRVHTGGAAQEASQALGARGYATGDDVVLGVGADLHTEAHEAAHVIQQRGGVQLAGGVGQSGDVYEQHADAVADAVVQGKSAEGLLDRFAGGASSSAVQFKGGGREHRDAVITRKDVADADKVEESEKQKAAEKKAKDAAAKKKAAERKKKKAEDAKKETLTGTQKRAVTRTKGATNALYSALGRLVNRLQGSVGDIENAAMRVGDAAADLNRVLKQSSGAFDSMRHRHEQSPRKKTFNDLKKKVLEAKSSAMRQLRRAKGAIDDAGADSDQALVLLPKKMRAKRVVDGSRSEVRKLVV